MIIRLTRHSFDEQIAVMHTPPELNAHIAKLPDARWSPVDRAYIIEITALPGLHAFAAHIGARIVDERTQPTAGVRTLPHECMYCAQPGSISNPPKFCPDCGATWTPVTPPISADPVRRHCCTACGHWQTGRFTHCTECSAVMQYKQQTDDRPMSDVRQHDEPTQLSTLVDTVIEGLT